MQAPLTTTPTTTLHCYDTGAHSGLCHPLSPPAAPASPTDSVPEWMPCAVALWHISQGKCLVGVPELEPFLQGRAGRPLVLTRRPGVELAVSWLCSLTWSLCLWEMERSKGVPGGRGGTPHSLPRSLPIPAEMVPRVWSWLGEVCTLTEESTPALFLSAPHFSFSVKWAQQVH